MRVGVLFILCWFFITTIYAHKHHETDLEDNWWEHLVEFEGIEQYSKDLSIDSWKVAGNLASLLRFQPIKRITLPVIVNLIFSGFNGYGNELFSLTEEQFEPWFGHLDHTFPHLIVPVGEEQTTTMPYPTENSKIFYGFHLNLVKLSPMFNTILQDQILWNLRPEIPLLQANSSGMAADEILVDFIESEEAKKNTKYYVDADHISSFLQAAAKGLGLKDSYNLFILNPSSSVDPGETYGYRSGFSQAEIDELIDVWGDQMEDEYSLFELLDFEDIPCQTEDPAPLPENLIPDEKANRVQVVDYTDESTKWANWFLQQQKNAERGAVLSNFRDDPKNIFSFAKSESKTVIELAEQIVFKGTEFEKDYLFTILLSQEEMTENCLVDNWISSGRTLFLDLTAGPFQWGPLVTSDGARTHHTLPKVPTYMDVVLEDKELELPEERQQIADMIQTKLQGSSRLYSQKCTGDEKDPPLCEELKKEMALWKQRFANLKKSVEQKREIEGAEEEGSDANWVKDNFLSRLSAVISQSIRQVLVPGSPLFPSPYTQEIVYDFYLISSHSDYDPKGPDAFDYEEFKSQIRRLSFSNQSVKFVLHQLNMADSVELASAFHSAKRSMVLPTLTSEGIFINSDVHYVDSITLRDSLKKIRGIQIQSDDLSFSKTRRIPILFFSLNYRHPILVDKYYAAKALSDMVLVVQNSQRNYPTRLACNGKSTFLNLRNPVKHALVATSLLVGGLLPSHITYSEAHQNAMPEWLWSVGDNPHSHTSYENEFNHIQIDLARRNMVIQAFRETIETVNTCVDILTKIRIDETNQAVSHLVPLNNLSIKFSQVLANWKRACKHVAALNFDSAILEAQKADIAADELFDLVMNTQQTMKAYQCLPHVVVETDTESQAVLVLPILFICFDILLFVIIYMCRTSKKSKKAKIN